MKTFQERTGGAIVPAGMALGADQPVPVGFLRVAPDRVVHIGGFLRDVMGSMAANAIDGTHDDRMQQVTAAAVAVEIARTVSPALGSFMENLCFGDAEGLEPAADDGEEYRVVRNDGVVHFRGRDYDVSLAGKSGQRLRVVYHAESGGITVYEPGCALALVFAKAIDEVPR